MKGRVLLGPSVPFFVHAPAYGSKNGTKGGFSAD
jgi:hypothetical protein